MGITANCARFLFYSKSRGVSFEQTLMLGRQHLYVDPKEIVRLLKKYSPESSTDPGQFNAYAEPLFKLLGAARTESLDFSDYEQATLIHDLNIPVPENLKNQFTLVFDGGTLEHIYNFPVAIKSCMEMLKEGGHFISITPANNQCGHGFYQFSPELFYSLFSEGRGFRVKDIFLAIDASEKGIREWYRVKNPAEVNARVTISNCDPTYLLVLAEKTKIISETYTVPFQSDYKNVWESFSKIQSNNPSGFKKIYKKVVPENVRHTINKIRSKNTVKKKVTGLGDVNPEYFEKFSI